jgi:membrane protein YqaA with SNARE-associated domain
MKHVARLLFPLFWKLGGGGLLILGILDSSFLFAPFGNDLLLVALSARHHSIPLMLYFAVMAAVGSVFGCLLVDLAVRRAGEGGLEAHLSPRRLAYLKRRVEKNGAWALVTAAMAPPPFPFTPFIMAAAALQYPRRRLLAVIGAARLVRYSMLGVLALRFGSRILWWAQSDLVQDILIGLIAVCVVGSAISVYGWIKRSSSSALPRANAPAQPARR